MLEEVKRLRKICDFNLKRFKFVPFKELNDLCEYNAWELYESELGDERTYLLENSLFVKVHAIKGIQREAG